MNEIKKRNAALREKLDKQKSANSGSNCYVVTASYGSEAHPNVTYLRNYRDKNLSKHTLGKIFISAYEIIGPLFAKMIKNSDTLKNYSSKYVIQPLINYLKKKEF